MTWYWTTWNLGLLKSSLWKCIYKTQKLTEMDQTSLIWTQKGLSKLSGAKANRGPRSRFRNSAECLTGGLCLLSISKQKRKSSGRPAPDNNLKVIMSLFSSYHWTVSHGISEAPTPRIECRASRSLWEWLSMKSPLGTSRSNFQWKRPWKIASNNL